MQSSRHAACARPVARVSRGVRVLRGAAAALVATLLAAASHGIAGGVVTWASVAATVVFTLPLCVALAGRVGSLWRLSIAVSASQFVYHWTFAGLGLTSGAAADAPMVSPHAAHLAALESFAPDLASAGAADASMWFWHAVAAVLTITLLARGERAVMALGRTLLRALPVTLVRLPVPVPRPTPCLTSPRIPLQDRLLAASAITLRGPPCAA
ncbi:hypothetical protein [Leucobacter sp. 7(1)]|uniref:hypothetical protein n=1 Tax=Leucobacter sp. 7(1) TaxID=1255613 RepID=UPI000B35349A|nr:hypothetical protein [Leucobacter sp. 7(1)]